MEFAFTDEQAMIADTARAFFAEHATSARTRAAMDASGPDAGIDRALWTAFCQDLGLGGIAIAEDAGGIGLGMVELAIIAEAAGAHVAALPMLGSLALCAQAIAAGGTVAQRETVLPGLIAGDSIAAWVDLPELTVAGDTLSGSSDFVVHGTAADRFVVSDGTRAWVVPATAPGVQVTPLTTMDQTRPYARVTLTDVAGDPLADGAAAIAATTRAGCIVLAAEALGGAQACLDRTVGYAMERVQFGRVIGSFQAYKHRLADMMVEIEQARSAVYWAACAVDEGADDVAIAVPAAKSFAADTYFRCAGDMIQLHGGIGFTWEHDAHLFFKRARATQTLLGDGNRHRETVATLILGEAA